jgi:hypothetical protein
MSSNETICKSFALRKTQFGGYDKTLVILDGEPVTPSKVEEDVGREIYCLSSEQWQKAIIITMYRSNKGFKDVKIYCPLGRDIAQKIYTYFKYSAKTPEEVLNYTLSLLRQN